MTGKDFSTVRSDPLPCGIDKGHYLYSGSWQGRRQEVQTSSAELVAWTGPQPDPGDQLSRAITNDSYLMRQIL